MLASKVLAENILHNLVGLEPTPVTLRCFLFLHLRRGSSRTLGVTLRTYLVIHSASIYAQPFAINEIQDIRLLTPTRPLPVFALPNLPAMLSPSWKSVLLLPHPNS